MGAWVWEIMGGGRDCGNINSINSIFILIWEPWDTWLWEYLICL